MVRTSCAAAATSAWSSGRSRLSAPQPPPARVTVSMACGAAAAAPCAFPSRSARCGASCSWLPGAAASWLAAAAEPVLLLTPLPELCRITSSCTAAATAASAAGGRSSTSATAGFSAEVFPMPSSASFFSPSAALAATATTPGMLSAASAGLPASELDGEAGLLLLPDGGASTAPAGASRCSGATTQDAAADAGSVAGCPALPRGRSPQRSSPAQSRAPHSMPSTNAIVVAATTRRQAAASSAFCSERPGRPHVCCATAGGRAVVPRPLPRL